MNELRISSFYDVKNPVSLNEREPFTLHTWEELLASKSIPNTLLAIVTLRTPKEDPPLIKIYEATNLREHMKMRGFVDPINKLPIDKINWIFMRTFNLNTETRHEFFPLHYLPDCFFESTDLEFPLHRIKEIFLKAFTMENPLPHDWVNSPFTKEVKIQLQAEIFSRSCNPSLDPKDRAQAQFVIAGSLLFKELNQPPESQALLQNRSNFTRRTVRSDEGIRNLACAKQNGHERSLALLQTLCQGYHLDLPL